jgi:hypothetical protein
MPNLDTIEQTLHEMADAYGEIAFTGNSAAELNDNDLIRQFYLGG